MKLSKEFKVGLFMVVAITLLYFGFNFLRGIDFFSSTNKYYVIYQNVDKLTESNQVFLNGYAVGRVSKIQIQQNKNRVVVEMDIESDIVLTDSTFAILNGELLGGRFIQLDVGRGSRLLKPKDTVTLDCSTRYHGLPRTECRACCFQPAEHVKECQHRPGKPGA